jgi:hypothetical protein
MARVGEIAEPEGRIIFLVDAAGFYLLPASVWTYASRRQTPILCVPLTHDHLSAISAITPDGELYMMVQECAFKGPTIVRFLRHLSRCFSDKLLAIWDGSSAHRSQAVKTFLAQGEVKRIPSE